MGALDDAIREHLELKRKRGEDPDTLAEKEAEAFGPARREPLPAEPAADETAPLAPDAEIFEPEVEADLDPVPEFDADPEPVAAAPEPVPEREPEPAARVHDPEHEPERTAVLEPDPAPPMPEPAPPMPEPEPVPPAAAADPPAPVAPAPEPDEAWEAEPPVRRGDTPPQGIPAVEEPAEGEDVLEETPDFLQDTPEHDRLWFEQKPPRDFDFDA